MSKREKKQIDKQDGLTDHEKEVLKRGIDKRPATFVEQVRRKHDGLCIGHTGPESECTCGQHAYVVTYY